MEHKGKLELTWVGKYDDKVIEPRILMEDREKSYGDPRSENMLIHGDNLVALQALQQDFYGSIKCIYIDPPYNTGSAFEHYDDNLEHSIWLNLMRKRLVLLRELLSEEGTIWIQIDDEEQAYLKVLCDEVFGRGNFVNMISVNMKNIAGASGGGEDKRLKKNCEYILMASNERAADIAALSDIQMSEIKALILDRLNIVKPEVRLDAENEIDQFIDWWKMLAAQGKPLRYYVYGTDKYNRLMNYTQVMRKNVYGVGRRY